jgi:hypothetical protein
VLEKVALSVVKEVVLKVKELKVIDVAVAVLVVAVLVVSVFVVAVDVVAVTVGTQVGGLPTTGWSEFVHKYELGLPSKTYPELQVTTQVSSRSLPTQSLASNSSPRSGTMHVPDTCVVV